MIPRTNTFHRGALPSQAGQPFAMRQAGTASQFAPVKWELPAIILIAISLWMVDPLDHDTQVFLNYVAPICLTAILGYVAIQMLLLDQRTIWTPMFWFRVGTAVYFGFGCIVPLIVNSRTLLYLEQYMLILTADIFKFNLIIAIGTACVLAANSVCDVAFGSRRAHFRSSTSDGNKLVNMDQALRIGLFFMVTGGSIKYLIMLPNMLAGTPVLLPSQLTNLTACGLVGISLLTIWALHVGKGMIFWILAILIAEVFVGLLLFSKAEALYPCIAFTLGILTVRVSRLRLIATLICFALTFEVLHELVTHARAENFKIFSRGGQQVDFATRIKFYMSYFDRDQQFAAGGEPIQGGLIRVSFTNAALFVISRYDRGVPGDSLRDVVYTLIPRALWPDKPEFRVAAELYTLAAGPQVESAISAGIFAEVYWNLGWLGMLLLVPIGIAFNVASRITMNVFENGSWIYLPVLFLNLKIAMGVDQFYVSIVGTFAISIATYVMLGYSDWFLRMIGILKSKPSGA